MKNNFHVRVVDFAELREIEGFWTDGDFEALLGEMEFGDTAGISSVELREICLMSLQDCEPEEAAALVLKRALGDELRDGQIRNIAGEMQDDKLWEEYSDMSLHEKLFNVGSLLFAALPRAFPRPDAVRVAVEVVATNAPAEEALTRANCESFVVRLLADGMGDGSVLHRMFDQQLDGKSFPQADTIVWIVETEIVDARTAKINVISSGYWLDALRDVESYNSTAHADDKRAN